MTPVPLDSAEPGPLPDPEGPLDQPVAPQGMNASELMYYCGAPLAHVVEYEDRVRMTRSETIVRRLTRSRPASHFAAPRVADAV